MAVNKTSTAVSRLLAKEGVLQKGRTREPDDAREGETSDGSGV